jgi:hypothetical protein
VGNDLTQLARRLDAFQSCVEEHNKLLKESGASEARKIDENAWDRVRIELRTRAVRVLDQVTGVTAARQETLRKHQEAQLTEQGRQLGMPNPVEHALGHGQFVPANEAVHTKF